VRAGDMGALSTFADQLEQRLKRRFASQPAAMRSVVQTILLAKKE
jgi:hypothetical protein